jgi:small subunit ribosomal protein S9
MADETLEHSQDATASASEASQQAERTASASETDLPELTLGSGAPAEHGEGLEALAPVIRGKIDRFGAAIGTGRRKTAVARVRVKSGTGQIIINDRPLEDYFRVERDRLMIEAPLKATDRYGKVDVWVRVCGGGTTGQTGAVILGIARALQVKEPELHHRLSEGGFLTRDGRMVERKKYGFKKARRSFQFSKR